MALWVVVALTWRMRRPALWQSRPGVVYFALPVILRSNLYEQQVHLFLGLKVIAIGCFKINDSYDGNRRTVLSVVCVGTLFHQASLGCWRRGSKEQCSRCKVAERLVCALWRTQSLDLRPWCAQQMMIIQDSFRVRGVQLREIGLKAP